jgi:hypothetical protein
MTIVLFYFLPNLIFTKLIGCNTTTKPYVLSKYHSINRCATYKHGSRSCIFIDKCIVLSGN